MLAFYPQRLIAFPPAAFDLPLFFYHGCPCTALNLYIQLFRASGAHQLGKQNGCLIPRSRAFCSQEPTDSTQHTHIYTQGDTHVHTTNRMLSRTCTHQWLLRRFFRKRKKRPPSRSRGRWTFSAPLPSFSFFFVMLPAECTAKHLFLFVGDTVVLYRNKKKHTLYACNNLFFFKIQIFLFNQYHATTSVNERYNVIRTLLHKFSSLGVEGLAVHDRSNRTDLGDMGGEGQTIELFSLALARRFKVFRFFLSFLRNCVFLSNKINQHTPTRLYVRSIIPRSSYKSRYRTIFTVLFSDFLRAVTETSRVSPVFSARKS